MKVYLLWHIHELTDDFGAHDEEKMIGVFSSAEKANETIERLKVLEGFRDCPLKCFTVDEYEVDKPLNWTEGFFIARWNEETSK